VKTLPPQAYLQQTRLPAPCPLPAERLPLQQVGPWLLWVWASLHALLLWLTVYAWHRTRDRLDTLSS
jgi:hypothetical protein